MYKAVRKVIDDHTESWSVLPAFQRTRDVFMEKLTQLERLGFQQSFITQGSGATKRSKRKEVAERAKKVQRALRALASVTYNTELYKQVKFGASRFYHGSNYETMQWLNLLIGKAEEYREELKDFGLSDEKFNALLEARDELETVNGMPRDLVIDRKTVTMDIDRTVAEIDALLRDQLDSYVVILKGIDLDFHNKYFNARVVVHLKATKSGSDEASKDAPEEPDDGNPGNAA